MLFLDDSGLNYCTNTAMVFNTSEHMKRVLFIPLDSPGDLDTSTQALAQMIYSRLMELPNLALCLR
jgi:hypothetical protein